MNTFNPQIEHASQHTPETLGSEVSCSYIICVLYEAAVLENKVRVLLLLCSCSDSAVEQVE
jgi:hypothetical protein